MRVVLKTLLLLISGFFLLPASPVNACSRFVPFSFDELFAGDVIVRVTAVKYIIEPTPLLRTTGVPESTVEFKVEETLKGEGVGESLRLNGYLSNKDDFNETPVPYKFVRPNGRAGSCFANTYKQGAQFLLFLKKTGKGYTSNISALGPTNEQLRSETDPWLMWVKVRLNPCGKLQEQDGFYEKVKEGKLFEIAQGKEPPSVKYRAAKCYLETYEAKDGADDQYIKYVKRWVKAYERAEEEK
jgi:hypothetical protein